MGIKGLEQVIANLNSLDRNMVPKASAWAINRVARTAVTAATRKVANETVAGDNRVKGIPVNCPVWRMNRTKCRRACVVRQRRKSAR